MNSSNEIDPIDTLLREKNADIEDGGFTARVVQSLPRQRRARLRPAFLLGATATGAVLAILWVPWGGLPALDSSSLLSPRTEVLLPWVVALAVTGSLLLSATAALQWED